MASKRTTTSTPVETIEAAAFDEALPTIDDAIDRFIKSVTVTSTHYRYKAIRAIAYQGFTNAIEDGNFDALVDQAINNAGELPAGWGVETAKPAPAKKPVPAAKKATPVKRGSTVATAEGVVIAEQRHIDATAARPAAKRTRKPAAKVEA